MLADEGVINRFYGLDFERFTPPTSSTNDGINRSAIGHV